VGGGSRVSVRDGLGLLEEFAGRPLDVRYEETQRGDVRHTGADTSRARDELGFEPRTPFADGLRAEFEWMRDSLSARRRPAQPRLVPAPEHAARGPRFLFHSNEIVGLGHLRRALGIAGALGDRDPSGGSLIVTGSPIAPFFDLPRGVDTVKLPARARDEDGTPRAPSLGVELDELRELRASIALAATESFAPDVVVVDKVPLGLEGELGATLRSLSGSSCRVVLGLRDIDDSAARVQRKWTPAMRDAIERFFDAVLVYGPSTAPDALKCLGWRDLSVPVHHVGYVATSMPRGGPSDLPADYVLATAGGGHDGATLLTAFARALRLAPLPFPAVIVPGPLMGADEVASLRELTRGLDVEVHTSRTDMERVIAGARAVVSMAGYNTVAELMRARKPGLLVPRVRPSEEQLVRARELSLRGLQQMLHPDALTPRALRSELDALLARPAPALEESAYDGSRRAAEILAGLAGANGELEAVEPAALAAAT
jgi:predicted glycosyltransferase